MGWRDYVVNAEDVPPLSSYVQLGFPEHLLLVQRAHVADTDMWRDVQSRWWDRLDEMLAAGRGIAAWDSPGQRALDCLLLVTLRLSFWPNLPLTRGRRVVPVGYTEAVDLNDNLEEARKAGTLLVAGVGAVLPGQSALDMVSGLVSLARVRARGGLITHWHLDPMDNDQGFHVCRTLVDALGDNALELGVGRGSLTQAMIAEAVGGTPRRRR